MGKMNTISVLYVDDEPTLLDLGKLFLEQGGQFSVDINTSAPAALTLLNTKKYDAIISDYQMPEMDGIEFLKRVRTSGNTIPFILFTGRGREEVVIQALNEGADFYLQKGGEPIPQFTESAYKILQAVQQRRTEISIRDHERREADIISFLPDATLAIDTNGVVIAWNRAAEKMTGVRASEILGKGNYEYTLPFYHERRPALIDLVLHDDPDLEAKYPLLKRDGQTLIAEATIPFLYHGRGATIWFTATPLFNTGGTITGAIESVRDMTDRKQAEIALRESEEKYRVIVESSFDGIAIHQDGILVYVNQTAARLLGAEDPAVFHGMPVIDIVAPAFRERTTKQIPRAPYMPLELIREQFLRVDGSMIDVDVTTSPGFWKGRPAAFVTFRDITAQVQAENALRESEERFRMIFNATFQFIGLLKPDGTVTEANQTAMDFVGVTPDQIIGKPFWDTQWCRGNEEHMLELKNAITRAAGGEFVRYEAEVQGKGETRGFFDFSIKPIYDGDGNVVLFIMEARDISERKKV